MSNADFLKTIHVWLWMLGVYVLAGIVVAVPRLRTAFKRKGQLEFQSTDPKLARIMNALTIPLIALVGIYFVFGWPFVLILRRRTEERGRRTLDQIAGGTVGLKASSETLNMSLAQSPLEELTHEADAWALIADSADMLKGIGAADALLLAAWVLYVRQTAKVGASAEQAKRQFLARCNRLPLEPCPPHWGLGNVADYVEEVIDKKIRAEAEKIH